MNKVGPAIFFFAFLSIVAVCISPGYGGIVFLTTWAVVAAVTLIWGLYSLYRRHWSGLFFIAVGAIELFFLFAPPSR
ncbi:MAG TPA: hypothetical protein VF593_14055 [Chthoniobacteraceae bacterium]|jgi:hypothetical protein